MPARENEQQTAEAEAAAPEVAPAPPEAAKTEFSSEGDLPAVAQGSGAAATGATASTLAFDGAAKQASGDTSHLDRGIHHWEEYKASCEAAGKPEKWKDYYRSGHTEAKGWTQPYEHRRVYEWDLEKGTSASQAVQDFLKGPTIADYRVAAVADDLDELRDEFGDQKFDKLFGSANSNEDSKIPAAQRLRITAASYSLPLIDQMKQIAREAEAAESPVEEAAPAAPQVEALVEEKPKAAPIQDQEPAVIAQELGLQQQDRELV
jgi:hypothetical protein